MDPSLRATNLRSPSKILDAHSDMPFTPSLKISNFLKKEWRRRAMTNFRWQKSRGAKRGHKRVTVRFFNPWQPNSLPWVSHIFAKPCIHRFGLNHFVSNFQYKLSLSIWLDPGQNTNSKLVQYHCSWSDQMLTPPKNQTFWHFLWLPHPQKRYEWS